MDMLVAHTNMDNMTSVVNSDVNMFTCPQKLTNPLLWSSQHKINIIKVLMLLVKDDILYNCICGDALV
jgi:hypothetical protein